jgi:hypothetical protein
VLLHFVALFQLLLACANLLETKSVGGCFISIFARLYADLMNTEPYASVGHIILLFLACFHNCRSSISIVSYFQCLFFATVQTWSTLTFKLQPEILLQFMSFQNYLSCGAATYCACSTLLKVEM